MDRAKNGVGYMRNADVSSTAFVKLASIVCTGVWLGEAEFADSWSCVLTIPDVC